MRLVLEEQKKYLQSFINNDTYQPMNPDADAACQIVNLFSSDKSLSTSFLIFNIIFHDISTTL